MIPTFIYMDKVLLVGRGWSYIGLKEQNPELKVKIGDLVVVDGELMKVSGVESFAAFMNRPDGELGPRYGLLLHPAPPLDQLAFVQDPRCKTK